MQKRLKTITNLENDMMSYNFMKVPNDNNQSVKNCSKVGKQKHEQTFVVL